ncbi:hypothetical protein CJ030_MR3G001065 [Morella rubra]|uniref:Uncharacterized protein n=1 Tax=Morella rubra TaxID=262757 RepID=A0A6A1W2K1_9ROSI|nr:hypothetical protein CJ030_MR3G001065 [Morella rubra]
MEIFAEVLGMKASYVRGLGRSVRYGADDARASADDGGAAKERLRADADDGRATMKKRRRAPEDDGGAAKDPSGTTRTEDTTNGGADAIHKMSGVKRARTTKNRLLMILIVAKERPVTLSDFDQLLYEEHSLYQLFEYQGFLHQLSWTEGFCVDAVVQDFFCALVSVDRAPEVQLEPPIRRVSDSVPHFSGSRDRCLDTRKEVKSALNKFTLSRSRGQEGALTRRFARRAAAAAEEASRPSTSASEAPMEMGAPVVPPPWVARLFADLDSRVGATMKATLQPVERQMQSIEEQLKELWTAFDGECM